MRINSYEKFGGRMASRAAWLSALIVMTASAWGWSLANDTDPKLLSCDPSGEYSCTYQFEKIEVQDVPQFFKFQARISQAKLPVGDVVFETIYVNLKSGSKTLCTEEHNNITVHDSVLNLEIGRRMNCILRDEIAQKNGLEFQICIGNQENCLKPVALSSVPYAIKSSFANMAQKAHSANEAMQCHYAHRMTADRNLFNNQGLGKGYYDFHTPSGDQILERLINVYDSQMSVWVPEWEKGGYIQWAQVDPASSNLHICAQKVGSVNNDPEPLDLLAIHARMARTLGMLVVDGPGSNDVVPGKVASKALTVTRQGVDIHGPSDFYDDVTFGDDVVVDTDLDETKEFVRIKDSHILESEGQTNLYGETYIGNHEDDSCDVKATLEVNGPASVNNTAAFYGDVSFESREGKKNVSFKESVTANFYGTTNFDESSTTNILGDLNIGQEGMDVDPNKWTHVYDNLQVHGTLAINGELSGSASGVTCSGCIMPGHIDKDPGVAYEMAELETGEIKSKSYLCEDDDTDGCIGPGQIRNVAGYVVAGLTAGSLTAGSVTAGSVVTTSLSCKVSEGGSVNKCFNPDMIAAGGAYDVASLDADSVNVSGSDDAALVVVENVDSFCLNAPCYNGVGVEAKGKTAFVGTGIVGGQFEAKVFSEYGIYRGPKRGAINLVPVDGEPTEYVAGDVWIETYESSNGTIYSKFCWAAKEIRSDVEGVVASCIGLEGDDNATPSPVFSRSSDTFSY